MVHQEPAEPPRHPVKVATRIVDVQQGFFDYGDEAMKPLVLADIADAVEMHESKIGRAHV